MGWRSLRSRIHMLLHTSETFELSLLLDNLLPETLHFINGGATLTRRGAGESTDQREQLMAHLARKCWSA